MEIYIVNEFNYNIVWKFYVINLNKVVNVNCFLVFLV